MTSENTIKVLDVITIEQLRALKSAGFVVIHDHLTNAMRTAMASTAPYHYGSFDDYFNKAVGASIVQQKYEDKRFGG